LVGRYYGTLSSPRFVAVLGSLEIIVVDLVDVALNHLYSFLEGMVVVRIGDLQTQWYSVCEMGRLGRNTSP